MGIDWAKYTIRFICGAPLGLLVGLDIWTDWTDCSSPMVAAMCLGVPALLSGTLSAIFADALWDWVVRRG